MKKIRKTVISRLSRKQSQKSLSQKSLSQKKRAYNARVVNVERGTFTPLVFSTTGGMGCEAATFFKRLAEKMMYRRQQRYSDIISFIRRRVRFDLLKTCLIALRGHRGKRRYVDDVPLAELDLNLCVNY